MSHVEPRTKLDWRRIAAAILLAIGIGMIALSLAWKSLSNRRANWSDDQALEYQAAAANLHRLSHEFADAAQAGNAQRVRDELDKAQAEYGVLRGQLDSARARPEKIATILLFVGLLLAAAGVVSLYAHHGSSGR